MGERPKNRRGPIGLFFGWVTSGGCTPILAMQWLLFLVAAFVPFGFDHPNRFGLHYDHLMFVAGSWVLLTLIGIVVLLVKRQPNAALVVLLNVGLQAAALFVATASGASSVLR